RRFVDREPDLGADGRRRGRRPGLRGIHVGTGDFELLRGHARNLGQAGLLGLLRRGLLSERGRNAGKQCSKGEGGADEHVLFHDGGAGNYGCRRLPPRSRAARFRSLRAVNLAHWSVVRVRRMWRSIITRDLLSLARAISTASTCSMMVVSSPRSTMRSN